MRSHSVTFIWAVFVLMLMSAPQAAAQSCGIVPESIVRLRAYTLGNYSQWDMVHGVQDMEKFTSVLFLPNGNMIAGGYHYRKGNPRETRALITEFNRRRRVLWDNRHEEGGRLTIEKLLLEGNGFVAFGNSSLSGKGAGVRIAWYNLDGTLKREKTLRDKDYDLVFESLIQAIGGKGYLLTVQARKKGAPGIRNGIALRLSEKGEEIWRRTYQPGVSNRFAGAGIVEDTLGREFYMVTGSVEADERRDTGLLMKLEGDGTLVWARQYPRGANAILRSVSKVTDSDFVVLGDIDPYGDLYEQSVWVMRIDTGGGDIAWQRYLAVPNFNAFGRTVIGHDDGRISLLVDTANLRDSDFPEQSRLLTLSPQGMVMRDEPYIEGRGGHGHAMVMSPKNQRVIVGYARQSHKANDVEVEKNYETDDGWILVTPGLDRFTDPCIPRRRWNE